MSFEWYFAQESLVSLALFYKDIESPIERIRTAGSDDNIELTFVNAEAGEVTASSGADSSGSS